MFRKIEKKVISLLKEYGSTLVKNSSDIYFSPNIPQKKLTNAIKKYAQCLRPGEVLALYDDTLFGSAEDGFIIAKKGIWYKNSFEKPRFFLYTQLYSADMDFNDKKLILYYDYNPSEAIAAYLDSIPATDSAADDWEIVKAYAENAKNMLDDTMSDFGKERTIVGINPKKMELFLNDIIEYVSKLQEEENNDISEDMSGQSEDSLLENQKLYEKKIHSDNKIDTHSYTNAVNATHLENDAQFQKYHNKRAGHGFAAEDANALSDVLSGKRVEKTGLDNELDGPDRIVDGIKIQTKYYQTPKQTLQSALDKQGRFRYDGQLLEVPKDQYADVLKIVQEKLDNGELFGKDGTPLQGKAEDIVKEGSITYQQAKNIAKAGNIDSIKFDIKNQAITTGCIMGASIIFSTAINIWHGKKSFSEAAQDALLESFQAGKTSMLVGVLSAQALRTKTAAAGTMVVRPAIKWMYKTDLGKVAIEKLAAISLGKSVSGAAAVNHVSKLLRSNIITGGITVAVVTAPGFYRSLFNKSQSWSQFFKDLSTTVCGVIGGVGGAYAGAAVGGAIGSAVPIIGNVVGAGVGGAIGAMAGGAGASIAGKKIADGVVDDDSVAIWNDIRDALEELATNYLLTEQELNEQLLPQVQLVATTDWLRTIYNQGSSSTIRRGFVYSSFEQFCDGILEDRGELSITTKALEKEGNIFISKASAALDDKINGIEGY